MKPLVVELFCGRFGWSRGFVAEGFRAVGFDIVHEPYHGPVPEGCSLALQDVLTLHGSQFRDAACIVASPPCQEYSYMAMPWKLAKAKAAAIRADETGEARRKLTALFDACFRIQREASEASGRYIPMVVENVKGAQPWVGPAKAHFGSFYLWGDVESVGGRITIGKFGQTLRPAGKSQKFNPDGTAHGQGSWFAVADSKNRGARKPDMLTESFNGHDDPRRGRQTKNGSWFAIGADGKSNLAAVAHNTESGHGQNPVNGVKGMSGLRGLSHPDGGGKRDLGGPNDPRRFNSKAPARKAASALIAEIPYDLAQWVARCFRPLEDAA